MDTSTVNQILKLNNDFYQSAAKDFSDTRERPWDGWKAFLDSLPINFRKDRVSVLDLGCGNGRFCKFLNKASGFPFTYCGIDNNEKFLSICKNRFSSCPNVTFKKLNIFYELNKLEQPFDIAVAFGVTHHIPSESLRMKWFGQLSCIIKPGGFLCLTFWNFNTKKAIAKAQTPNLEEGDYILGWKKDSNAARYAHSYSPQELGQMLEIMSRLGLKLYKEYEADKQPNSYNHYFIFNKTQI